MEYNGRGAVVETGEAMEKRVSRDQRDNLGRVRTERGNEYQEKEDSKTKVLVVAQPVGQLVKTLIVGD